mmetsp:Transcript_115601/g.331922  ORF Transcript_115601/g.331922 Transcript_115601/m.331922 type:complete len:446 (-) Transcript_115601:2-1339(-)
MPEAAGSQHIAQCIAAVLLQLHPSLGESDEESRLVVRELLHVLLELRVLDEREVGLQHDGVAPCVPVLRLALLRLLLGECLVDQILEVAVIEFQMVLRPLSVEARALRVAFAHRVRAGQSHDRAVVEALRSEHLPQMVGALVTVGQAPFVVLDAVGRAGGVRAAEPRGDLGAAHFADRNVRGQGPKIGMGDEVRDVLLRDVGNQLEGDRRQAGVRRPTALAGLGEAQRTVRATAGALHEDAGVMPRQADEDGAAVLLGQEVLDIANEVVEGHRLFDHEADGRIGLALVQHDADILAHAVDLDDAVPGTEFRALGRGPVPSLRKSACDAHDGQQPPVGHEVDIQPKRLRRTAAGELVEGDNVLAKLAHGGSVDDRATSESFAIAGHGHSLGALEHIGGRRELFVRFAVGRAALRTHGNLSSSSTMPQRPSRDGALAALSAGRADEA